MIKKDIKIVRGDDVIIKAVFGDVLPLNATYYLTAKKTQALTDDRLIDVQGVLMRVNNTSELRFEIEKINTADIINKEMYYDIVQIHSDEEKTLQSGKLILDYDVRTPFDGFALPENATRFIQIDANVFADKEMIIVDVVNNEKVFRPISLVELKDLLNNV